jgi:hypothetical protein
MDLRFNHNLVPIGGMGKPIEMGGMTHRMLEAYYLSKRAGNHPDENLGAAIKIGTLYIEGCAECLAGNCTVHKDSFKGLENITIEDAYWVLQSMREYHERWKNDSWATLEVEVVKGAVIYEDDNISLMWKAKIDWLVDNLEGIFSVDHKTMSRQNDPLTLNDQFMGQVILTKQNKMFVNKFGFQKSLKPEERFERVAMNYSDARKTEWIKEVAGYAYDIIDCQRSGQFRHNFTSCLRAYGPCIFRRVCEGEPNDRTRLLTEQFKINDKVWDITND